ncbi:MAG: hypothetical protein AMJ78_01335 [Omnitrophica WOR_2 bacterium SM23_29]|nr:MAG: hypothetical protein AMJ78_01335 [Omnitrophica WOR_2 bacterium SM23_29]
MKRKIYRIIDANLNRSREGLRVCEEIARFILNDKSLTKEFKALRHRITNCIRDFPAQLGEIVSTRDAEGDVGRQSRPSENKRRNWKEIFLANLERVKESLRVLEEFSKLVDKKIADRFKKIRFKLYDIEKKLISRF